MDLSEPRPEQVLIRHCQFNGERIWEGAVVYYLRAVVEGIRGHPANQSFVFSTTALRCVHVCLFLFCLPFLPFREALSARTVGSLVIFWLDFPHLYDLRPTLL